MVAVIVSKVVMIPTIMLAPMENKEHLEPPVQEQLQEKHVIIFTSSSII